MRVLFVFLVVSALSVSALSQNRTSFRLGMDILESEILQTKGTLWVRQSAFAATGGDSRPMPAYTAVGSKLDYTPHFASFIPNVRSYIRVTVGANYVPLANGDAKFDDRARLKAADQYFGRNSIDKNSEFAKQVREGFKSGEISNFVLFAKPKGYIGPPIEMYWDREKDCFEGFMDITNVDPDLYLWEFTWGIRNMRERIKINLLIAKPTINRPSTQYNEELQTSEFVICDGRYFSGINSYEDLWKLTVYIRRATFESHGGTSWDEADTAGGYLSVVPVPPSFKPGMQVSGSSSGKSQVLPAQILNSQPLVGLPRQGEPRRQVDEPRRQESKKPDVSLTPDEREPVTVEVFTKSINGKSEKAIRIRAISGYQISFADGRRISDTQTVKASQSVFILASALAGYNELLVEAEDYTVVIDLSILKSNTGFVRRYKG